MICLAVGSCIVMLPTPKPLSPSESAAKAASEKLLSAMIRCENQTKSQLADPEGFDPETYGNWRVLPDEVGDGYEFRFKARARNGFGGLVWADFRCHATYDGSYWTAEISQE
jgi:hypothetical protein